MFGDIRVAFKEDVDVMTAKSIRMLAEVQVAGIAVFAAEFIAIGFHFRDQIMDCFNIFYNDQDIDDRLGFDPWDGCAADVMY